MKYWMLLLLLAVALGANGQTFVEVDSVELFLDGDACQNAPDTVSLVFAGSDKANSAQRDQKNRDRWVWHVTVPRRVDLETVRAYVRFNKRRTEYQKPQHYARRTLTFRFPLCNEEPVPNLTVLATDNAGEIVSLRYERELDGHVSAWDLNGRNTTIYRVWFLAETVNLRLPWRALLVISPKVSEKPLFVMSDASQRHLVPNPILWTHSAEKPLLRPDIVHVVEVQTTLVGARWGDDFRNAAMDSLQKTRLEKISLTLNWPE